MKKKLLSILVATTLLLTCIPFGAMSISAATSGDYTYTVNNGEATITGYSGTGGDITIPSTLGGYPVTAIGDNAFAKVDNTYYYFDDETLTLTTYVDEENEYCFGTRNDRTYTSVGPVKTSYNNFACKLYEMSDDSEPTVVTEPETDKAYKFGMIQKNVSNSTVYYLNGAMNGYYMDTTTDWDTAIDVYLESDIDGYSLFTKDADGNRQFINMVVSGTFVNGVYEPHRVLTAVTIPNSVITIGSKAFERCHDLVSVIIGNGVTTIGKEAFGGCESLTSITIPDSVITINDYAFSDCYDLMSVTIPNSVTSIGRGAFDYCYDLTDVYYSGSEYEMEAIDIGYYNDYLIDADWHYADEPAAFDWQYIIENGEVTITQYTGNGGDVTIPSTIEDYPVTVIGNEAFNGNYDLYSVIIPDSVITIGDEAFFDCTDLTAVTIGNSVTTIGKNAFNNCSTLTSVTIPDSVITIGDGAFCWCKSLTEITIPNSVITIGDSAFCWCESLTEITIPTSVTTIGNFMFQNCHSLTDVDIPDGVTTIGKFTFNNCTSLTKVVIPNSVTTIGNAAFDSCLSLTEVTIPNSVTTIGYQAFYMCTSLTEITIPNGVTSIDRSTFCGCYSLTKVTIPNSVTTIGNFAFDSCTSLNDVYYGGTETNKTAITIGSYNDSLLNATWHYADDPISDTVTHSVMDTANGNGLAFRFELSAKGVAKDAGNVMDLSNATVNYLGTDCKLIAMGAVLTNNAEVGATAFTLEDVNSNTVLNIPTVYLQEADEDSCAFSTRIINIPDNQLERIIYARPYYIVEVDGEEITVYGNVNSATCAEYL